MREILFKGFSECENGKSVITINGEQKRGNWLIGDLITSLSQAENYAIRTCLGIAFDVLPETVSQYTGLTDKNGKIIFEGDIINFDRKIRAQKTQRIKGVAFWEQEICAYSVSDEFKFRSLPAMLCDLNNVVVIGNIFDNPELVEDKQ